MKALLYLNLRLLKNTIMAALRNPKVVLPFLFLGTLLSFPILTFYSLDSPSLPLPFTTETVKPALFSFLTFITWMTVIHSTTKSTLVFSLSEIDFLFPSPLKRKTILFNRLLINYAKIMVQYLFLAGFGLLMISSVFGIIIWPRILFLWLAIVLIMMFASNLGDLVSLVSSHYSELRRTRNRRILMGAGLLFLGFLGARTLLEVVRGEPVSRAAMEALNSTVVRILMYPMAAASDVAVAWTLTVSTALEILFLLGLSVLSIWAVLSVETHFYEASEATSRELWQSLQKIRRQEVVVSESFVKRMLKIAPFGTGSTALIWKNLVGLLRDIRSLLPTFVMAAIFFSVMVARGGRGGEEFYFALFMLFFLVFVTAGYIRWDLREDLRRIEIIKLIPDSNFRIVLSEVAVPALFSTLISYLFLGISVFLYQGAEHEGLLVAFSVLALPLFGVMMVSLLNLAALYYPPQTGNQSIPGILSMFGMMIVLMPSLLVGLLLVAVGRLYMALGVVFLVNVMIAGALLKLLARKYRTFDLTAA
jgi:ABC-2 type transport system permease protein